MKKIIAFSFIAFLTFRTSLTLMADPISTAHFYAGVMTTEVSIADQLYAGFVGSAKFAIESTTEGVAKPEFLSNFIEIGNAHGGHILAVDSGICATILPNSSQLNGAEFTSGVKIHLAPLIRSYVNLPQEWQFLRNLEVDARSSYDWTLHHPFYGLVAAYPFK